VNFYVDDAVPDLIGATRRTRCAQQLQSAQLFHNLASCDPNLVFTSSKTVVAGQPMAIFVVTENNDLKTYRADGTYTGMLPVGEYLVVDATPQITTPNAPGVLFLVNLNTVNHYLITSRVLQGFGDNPAIDERYAGIKDGFIRPRAF
jgi:hypothetical protein